MFVNTRQLLTFSNQELDQLFKIHINLCHFRINLGASINQLKGFYQLENVSRISGVFSDVVVFPIKCIRRQEIGSHSFWLPLIFLNKQQISCLSYKLANWEMVFQNHAENKLGLYIHFSCKEEDVSAQKERGHINAPNPCSVP